MEGRYASREMLQNTPHGSIVEAMEVGSFPSRLPTLSLMVKVCDTVKTLLGYRGLTEYTPLWENRNLDEIQKMGKIKEWERCGIKFMSQLYKDDTLKSFQELRQ